MAGEMVWSFEDEVLNGLSDAEMRQRAPIKTPILLPG